MKEKYQLLLCFDKQNHNFSGLLTGDINMPIKIDPSIILPDLIEDYNSPFYGKITVPRKEKKQYKSVIDGIKKIIEKSYNDGSNIDLLTVELLRPYYELTYVISPQAKIGNQICELYYDSFEMEEVIEKGTSMYEGCLYICFSVSDIVFSILHFLAINECKFAMCEHCERFFATNTYKVQFCSRFSKYPNREHKLCAEASKDIRQDIRRKRKSLYNRVSHYGDMSEYIKYAEKFDTAFDIAKRQSNYSNFDSCYQILEEIKQALFPKNIKV